VNSVQITFRGMTVSEALAEHIRDEYEALGRYHDRIHSCHVVIEQPHRHKSHGREFQCHITLHVPGRELAVSRGPSDPAQREDPYETVDEAFRAARRMLIAYAQKRHDHAHGPLPEMDEAPMKESA
jgi:ribosomal subunit interface protein